MMSYHVHLDQGRQYSIHLDARVHGRDKELYVLSVGYKKHAEMDSVIVAIISHNSQLTLLLWVHRITEYSEVCIT